ncbi:MAG TPA: YqeG family HAD IIIA-type phosphatase [Candidatus Sulfotelmatobacter sp.]|nr:YqeG family HAD IIIA-type phosphatase [Candidatus Sulfotelmatobacter sp.]
MSLLKPAEYHRSIFEIDLERLQRKGFRAIMLDLDNTMVRWNHPDPTPGLMDWLSRVKAMGFAACIVSNNSGPRVSEFAAKVGIPFISGASKPRRKGFREAMSRLGVLPEHTVVIGDQIFTDVLGGNRSGAYTVLVVPIDPREFFLTQIVRKVERRVLKYLDRKGLLTRG